MQWYTSENSEVDIESTTMSMQIVFSCQADVYEVDSSSNQRVVNEACLIDLISSEPHVGYRPVQRLVAYKGKQSQSVSKLTFSLHISIQYLFNKPCHSKS